MKKLIISALVAGIILLTFSELGLFMTIRLLPGVAMEYFNPAFDRQQERVMLYYIHPFIISFALSWFWTRFKTVLTGSFLARGIEFGLIYVLVATFPMMWLIYSAMDVSLAMVATWLVLALMQGVISGLVFEKLNP